MSKTTSGNEEKKVGITSKKESDFSEWYVQVLINSGFIDYSDVSGAIVFKPDSYFVWEAIQKVVDPLFKKYGVQNAYFPLFIPERLLSKEAAHIKGFSAEVAWVTEAGSSKLDERLAVRPTSETIMYASLSRWVRSWRDLPIRLNQWNNVVRWEFKHPVPFFRTREFLWNEGHTAFATKEEADAERDTILAIYEHVLKDYLAVPYVKGRKTDSEKFAGGLASFSLEHLLPNGKAIQGPDWHSDGQNFSKAFDIMFLNREGAKEYVYQNTFAISTREIGVMIAIHSDNKGLVIPPKVARMQVVIVPIYTNDNKEAVLGYAREIMSQIRDEFRVFLDDDDAYSPGWKFNEYELKGIPMRIEVGRKEVEAQKATLTRRDTGAKELVAAADIKSKISAMLEDMHYNLYAKAQSYLNSNIFKVDTYAEMKARADKGGFIQAPWCGSDSCEAKIKEETGLKSTNMPFDAQDKVQGKKCVYCINGAKYIVNFAKSY
jgi:prolyl-tRNA synthetase